MLCSSNFWEWVRILHPKEDSNKQRSFVIIYTELRPKWLAEIRNVWGDELILALRLCLRETAAQHLFRENSDQLHNKQYTQNENVPGMVFLFHLHSCPDSSGLIATRAALWGTREKLSKSQDWNVNRYKTLSSYFQEHKGNAGAKRGQKIHLDCFWAWQFCLPGIFSFCFV